VDRDLVENTDSATNGRTPNQQSGGGAEAG